MKALIIEQTAQTPRVYLDPDKQIFEISNISLPEDADEFYAPVIKWLENYLEQSNEQMNFHFKLDYYNTASARYISTIIRILDNISQKQKIKIFWYYREIDEDMQLMGEEYEENTQLEFELVEI